MWSCLSGYRPSYFVLEGGKGVGRSLRESQALLLCRSTPRALAKDWWSVRAQSCLPDPFSYVQSICKQTQQCYTCTGALPLLLTMVDIENCTQLAIYSDIHRYLIVC